MLVSQLCGHTTGELSPKYLYFALSLSGDCHIGLKLSSSVLEERHRSLNDARRASRSTMILFAVYWH